MNLEFIKEGNIWVAEFEATSDFNLHIERVDDGLLKVMQRGTTEGEYVDTDIRDAGKPCYKNFDYDVAAFVYPKWIKVISGTEVITASVNFNEGGGSGSGSSDDNNSKNILISIRNDSAPVSGDLMVDTVTMEGKLYTYTQYDDMGYPVYDNIVNIPYAIDTVVFSNGETLQIPTYDVAALGYDFYYLNGASASFLIESSSREAKILVNGYNYMGNLVYEESDGQLNIIFPNQEKWLLLPQLRTNTHLHLHYGKCYCAIKTVEGLIYAFGVYNSNELQES